MSASPSIPSVSVKYAQDGSSTKSNALGMRPVQERAWQKRSEQYLRIKSPPASGKSLALMFIELDKLANQKLKQASIVVPEKNNNQEKAISIFNVLLLYFPRGGNCRIAGLG